MAIIRATCGECGDVEMTTADVWVKVRDDESGTYSFRCPVCQVVVTKPAEPHIVELLVSSGVRWSAWRPPAELEEHPGGLPITYDDLIDFHDLLATADWFQRLSAITQRR